MSTVQKVLTVGTGAVGAIYSWRLAKAGAHVTTVCRSNYAAVSKDGFQIKSANWGDEVYRPWRVVKTTEEAAREEKEGYDFVVVTMKALPDIYDIVEVIRPVIKESKTTIVLIQNGLGIERPLTTAFPTNPLLSTVTYIGVSQFTSGKIIMSGFELLKVASYPSGSQPPSTLGIFMTLLLNGGIDAHAVSDIMPERWLKCVWNGSFSPLCVATGLDTRRILSSPILKELLVEMMREVIAAAAGAGYRIPAEETIADMIDKTERIAMGYKPSMLLDSENARPLEVEAILGEIVREAKRTGIKTVRLETMYAVCKGVHEKALKGER